MELDNKKLQVVDWLLKPMMTSNSVYCYDSHQKTMDFKNVGSCVQVVGTELQLYNLFCYMLEKHAWQQQDSYNRIVEDKHKKLYKENNNEALIINLI